MVVMAKYLNGEGGGGTLKPLELGDPHANTLSREALHGCACKG